MTMPKMTVSLAIVIPTVAMMMMKVIPLLGHPSVSEHSKVPPLSPRLGMLHSIGTKPLLLGDEIMKPQAKCSSHKAGIGIMINILSKPLRIK